MTSSKPYLRKKAVLVLYKVFEKYPQCIPLVFDNLKKKLVDNDVSVVCCTINVVCELAAKRPRKYVSLVPCLFTILETSQNNWMLIKIVKLLVTLMPEEPRLAKKTLPQLCNIIQTTPAKSLMYECIRSKYCNSTNYFAEDCECRRRVALYKNMLEKLKLFLEDRDQNLKYLGLVGFHL